MYQALRIQCVHEEVDLEMSCFPPFSLSSLMETIIMIHLMTKRKYFSFRKTTYVKIMLINTWILWHRIDIVYVKMCLFVSTENWKRNNGNLILKTISYLQCPFFTENRARLISFYLHNFTKELLRVQKEKNPKAIQNLKS